MKKEAIISILIYILVILITVIGIPILSEKASYLISNENYKTEYKLYHPSIQKLNSQEEINTTETQKERDITEYLYNETEEIIYQEETKLKTDKPIIVIVIDDFGYRFDEIVEKAIIELPITVSIIPFTQYYREIYTLAKRYNREIILHIPMEAYNNKNNEEVFISSKWKEEEIISYLEKAFSEIDAIGINNHMGSKATEDERIMSIILSFIREKNKIFLDSFTTPNTVGYKIAKNYNLTPLKRDVFIDNYPSRYYIMDQLEKLEKISKLKGYAIGIGHIRKETIITLEKWYKKNSNKYRFIKLSELNGMLKMKI